MKMFRRWLLPLTGVLSAVFVLAGVMSLSPRIVYAQTIILANLSSNDSSTTALAAPATGTGATNQSAPALTARQEASATLVLATTSQLEKTGLLDELLPVFRAKTGIEVLVEGTSATQALRLAEEGRVDVVWVNSTKREEELMRAGHGARREVVMYSDYVIVGPANDPVDVRTSVTAVDALTKVYQRDGIWVAPSDNSPLQSKEKAIWKLAEIDPNGTWYVGSGSRTITNSTTISTPSTSLALAAQLGGYTLVDRTIWLDFNTNNPASNLILMLGGDVKLTNPYGIIAVNPSKGPQIKAEPAEELLTWLMSEDAQQRIANFVRTGYSQGIFFPGKKK